MSIPAQCPLCGARFKARDEYAGKRVKCPQCEGAIRIPLKEETAKPVSTVSPKELSSPSTPSSADWDELSLSDSDIDDLLGEESQEAPQEEPDSILPVTPAPVFVVPSPRPQPWAGAPEGSRGAAVPQRTVVPLWMWIVMACSLTGLVVGGGVFAALRWSASSPSKTVTQADSPQRKSSTKGGSERKKKSSGLSDEEALPGAPTSAEGKGGSPSAQKAKTIREILEGVVKIEFPVGPGQMSMGAGFFIDPRGWVATNYHVIAQANSATRVRLYDGTVCQVAGILAQEPSMDLAILKLANPPPQVRVLDIGFSGDPELGEEIRACGHPHNLSFTFVEGTIGRIITTTELFRERPNAVLAQMKAPPDMVWIQHSARIAQGNSGGPLVNKQGQVLGINSFVNELFGYAVPVRYLRALIALCRDDQVTPLPDQPPPGPASKPEEPSQPSEKPEENTPTPKQPPESPPTPKPPAGSLALSPQELQKLFDACAGFQWKPENAEQYSDLEVFARAMSIVKHFQTHPEAAPGAPKEAVAACAEKADQLFAELQKVQWTKDHWSAIHKFAAERLNPNQGVLLQGTVLMNSQRLQSREPTRLEPMILVALEEADQKVLVQVGVEEAKTPETSKVWFLGIVIGSATLSDNQGAEETYPRIKALYFLKVE